MLILIGYLMIGLALVLLVLSLVLAIVWKVPSLIDELSGRKARKQIEMMRTINTSSGKVGLLDTNELYRSVSNAAYYLSDDNVLKDSLNQNDTFEVKEKEERGNSIKNSIKGDGVFVKVGIDDSDTELLENNDLKGLFNIKIIEERSSIDI